ncbi:hypothetical protein GCM10011316_24300 [Roseibium aquae]|uniref:Surface antigen domain-containing protein n=2 Tax=Roseibium aquae TaxID=1323746 RepID=A0A916TLK3_9HYPH|nr:hypothetical protein GCM10011316_24300 [Roseibium aquae]
MIAGIAAGCSQVTVPLGSTDVETPMLLTGAISSGTDIAYADIGQDDRAFIAEAIGSALSSDLDLAGVRVPWSNPDSGNSGTLTDLDTDALAQTGCLGFSTTANTIAGVQIYSGTACRDARNAVLITGLSAGPA